MSQPFEYWISQKLERMPRWRAEWPQRECRLQLQLLTAELVQLRTLKPNVRRLQLAAKVEKFLHQVPEDGLESGNGAVRHLRDELEAESIRAVLSAMTN